MRTIYLFVALLFVFCSEVKSIPTRISVFDEILFYDGYAGLVDNPHFYYPYNVVRHKNSLYAVKLTEDQLAAFGENTVMHVIIKASCDNYDRIGNVNLALVPKGLDTYKPGEVDRIELGRYITPFMNKNRQPDEVPYSYRIDYIKHILKEETLLSQYDFWIELELFGVPYAANTEVAGCSGRNDVFYGTVYFETSDTPAELENDNFLLPLFIKQAFNNYKEGATDEIGKTIKSKEFTLDTNLKDAMLVLVTSNHGAESGGEEYSRRMHYVYLDDEEILSYKPGRTSCEPFRQYNTYSNKIYGSSPKSDAQWQSFSNWCPGDVIDNRIIQFDYLAAGKHTFRIEVPDAKFVGGKGNFPLSLFLLGKKTDEVSIGKCINNTEIQVFPNPVKDILNIETSATDKREVCIYDMMGQLLYSEFGATQIDMSSYPAGMYTVVVKLDEGNTYSGILIKQ